MLHPERPSAFPYRGTPCPGPTRSGGLAEWPAALPLPAGWWLAPAVACGAAIWVSGVSALINSVGG